MKLDKPSYLLGKHGGGEETVGKAYMKLPDGTLVPVKFDENKTYYASSYYTSTGEELTGFSEVDVNYTPTTYDKKVITANGKYDFKNESSAIQDEYDGYGVINVSVQPVTKTKTITANGTYDATKETVSGKKCQGYSKVTVNVATPDWHGGQFANDISITQLEQMTFDGKKSFYDGMYYKCKALTNSSGYQYVIPAPSNSSSIYLRQMFCQCEKLEKSPFYFNSNVKDSMIYTDEIFYGCYKLKSVSFPVRSGAYGSQPEIYDFGSSWFLQACYNLRDFKGYIRIIDSASRIAWGTYLFMLTHFNLGNTAGSDNHGSMLEGTCDLTHAGYFYEEYPSFAQLAGLTDATLVTNDATYEALKNNPDYWTTDYRYSRYNHASAAETLKSLPSLDESHHCVIKFNGEAGSLTDGGAIKDLTDEEIAYATSRGFTVSIE